MFTNLLSTPIRIARDQLLARLNRLTRERDCAILPANPDLLDMLSGAVCEQLEQIIRPTLVLELNVSRLRGDLEGPSAEARYNHFVDRLAQPDIVAGIALEYPELFRLADQRLAMWQATSMEFVERLCQDWPAIQRTFFNDTPGTLSALRFVQRSTKRGGRGVVVLTFTSGERLVYKPRSLAAEQRFQELLSWLNDSGLAPDFRLLRTLDRQTHGWMEWVNAATCMADDEIKRFYYRQGAYLALLTVLEATDLHMSNVIAAGEYPMIIDLEALFHPRDATAEWPSLDLLLDDTIYYSVLRPGILPEPETAADGSGERFDMSGLAGSEGQRTPSAVPTWVARGTDAMRLERQRRPTRGGRNRPTLREQPIDPAAYLDQLEAGFARTYNLLLTHRHDLLASGGPLDRFAGIELRVMRRSGRQYESIRERSYHPDLLRDATARTRFIRQELELDADGNSDLLALIPAELHDLTAGDVPMFANRNGSAEVLDSRGEPIPGLSPATGLDTARRRIATLNETDLARQRWFLRASFATLPTAPLPDVPLPTDADRPPAPDANPNETAAQALRAARAIGEWLRQTALRDGDEASWVGLEPDEEDSWSIEQLGTGLAHGLPGVIAFLTRLGTLTNETDWADLAGQASNTLLRTIREDAIERVDPSDPVGLFEGIGGQLYGLTHAIADRIHPQGQQALRQLVEQGEFILREAGDEELPSLAHGVAGLLTGLLVAHQAYPGCGALPVARHAGDILLSRLMTPEDTPNEPLATFWYGPGGAAGPLLRLAQLSGEARFRTAGESLLEHTLSTTRHDLGHWRSYLLARPWLQNSGLRETADVALRRALLNRQSYPLGGNHSIGDGALGVIDLLLEAATAVGDSRLRQRAGSLTAAVLADIARSGPQTSVPLGLETPGFVAGWAGIGYGLLRVAEPDLVPPLPTLAATQGTTIP